MTPNTLKTESSDHQSEFSGQTSGGAFLNAFTISNPEDLSWDVGFYTIKPDAANLTLTRGKAKNLAWNARRQFKAQCSGFSFAIEVDDQTVAVPATWKIPDGANVEGFTFNLAGQDVITPSNAAHRQLVARILKEGIKGHFKSRASLSLGSLWQDYNAFCEMPAYQSEHGFYFCKKFEFDPKPLRDGIWVVRYSVTSIALDGQTIEAYYNAGDVASLGEIILLRLKNKAARSRKPVAVRVWYDQRVSGGIGAKVYELDEPSLILQHGKLSPEEQKNISNLPVSCMDFGRPEKLSAAQTRLILDTQITQEDHDEAILAPPERGRLAGALRDATDGCDVFGNTLRLETLPLDSSRFPFRKVCPPPICVRAASGVRVLAGPSEITPATLQDRVKTRIEHIRRYGFYDLRQLNPLVAVPRFLGKHTALLVRDILNQLLEDRGIKFRFHRYALFQNVEDIRREAEAHQNDALIVVLPEGRRQPPYDNDTHEQLKRKVAIPSQCVHHDTISLKRWEGYCYADIERLDRREANRLRNRLDQTLGNMLVKAHCFPFVPAAPFHYNVHVGIDVGGQFNDQVMACLGYGFHNPKDTLFFRPIEIPMDVRQSEPVPPDPLFAGLLRLFEEAHSEILEFDGKPDFEHTLFIRDGQFQGAGDEWNEFEALKELFNEALKRGWISKNAVWTGVEVMKAAEGWRIMEKNESFDNPIVGYCCFPFIEQNEALLCTTGAPYLTQGTAAPLKVRVLNIEGNGSVYEVVRDLVWEADMCFTKPDMGQSLPWTLQIADTGALQLARSYRISGITV